MARKKPVSDQVIVIAGGSYGLGRAIAGEAARKGGKVVVGACTTEALTGSLADIEAEGSEGLTVKTDVSERDQVDWLVAAAVERFGRIDTYVANAMVTVYSEAHLLEDDELRRVFDVNFFGSVYGYWASRPHLRDTKAPSSRSTPLSRIEASPCRPRTAHR
jgi:NAD(P)-dependent dehydrogenase (short-subunit alcohol dehydrogenase family)